MSCKCENLEDKIKKYRHLRFKSIIEARKAKEPDEIFKELNIHNECCRKKIKQGYLKIIDEINEEKIINLILVSEKARPAALLQQVSDGQLRKLKRRFPNLIYTALLQKEEFSSYFVSRKKLPVRKTEEDSQIYTGRILGYQNPVNFRTQLARYFVHYWAINGEDKIDFYAEGIIFKSRYKSNKEKFAKALKPYGYTVEEEIKKNPKYKSKKELKEWQKQFSR